MHLICRIGVPLPEMPCARQLNRKKIPDIGFENILQEIKNDPISLK
jgi:hypothetical protein